MNLFWIIVGVLLAVLMMALIINPPEAWIKKVFHGKRGDDTKAHRLEK